MRVLVTGGAGFIGSHLVDQLVAKGHGVVVVDNLSTGKLHNLPAGVNHYHFDVANPMLELFAEVRPHVVYHLAAQVSVPSSVLAPGLDLVVNGVGTANVMEAAARSGVRKVIAVSSAAIYGKPLTVPITEVCPAVPLSPYGLSKVTAEHYVQMLGQLHGIAYTVLRPANVFGTRQLSVGEGAVIPTFLTRFLSGCDPVVHGDGTQSRDFVYVDDMVQALLLAMDRGDGMVLNVSGGRGIRVIDLWHELARATGWTRPPVFGPPRSGDIPHSVLDNRGATCHLGWKPTVSLHDGIAATVRWMKTLPAVLRS